MSSNINRCRTSKDRMAKNIKKRSNVMTITTHNPAVSKFVPIKSQQEFYKDNLSRKALLRDTELKGIQEFHELIRNPNLIYSDYKTIIN